MATIDLNFDDDDDHVLIRFLADGVWAEYEIDPDDWHLVLCKHLQDIIERAKSKHDETGEEYYQTQAIALQQFIRNELVAREQGRY